MYLNETLVQFSGTNTRQCLSLNITNDDEIENTEVVTLMLEMVSTTQSFYMAIDPAFTKIKIIDDDSMYQF